MVISDREAEQRVERMAGAIYGTIVVAGVLATTDVDDDPRIWPTAIYVVATVVVFWLAHAWALSLARRASGTEQEDGGLGPQLRHTWPLVQSAFPPIGVMLFARVAGADDELAIEIAGWSCVVLLAGWGVVVARRERESTLGIIWTSVGCAALGLTMIVLKAVVH